MAGEDTTEFERPADGASTSGPQDLALALPGTGTRVVHPLRKPGRIQSSSA